MNHDELWAYRDQWDCHENRFEVVNDKTLLWSKNRRSNSPDFSKTTERKDTYDPFKNMKTYDYNAEY